eukprot:TRINITY_DN39416_c0_g2_i1.p1 TRINITY_DN39416_c0_g2~~TRINITY_DN39416_c0_g2_i1.p1  ORF type:complete len:106 (+),score=13.66 TRINITY_DN39416_c0_g2_i1:233-550(+)
MRKWVMDHENADFFFRVKNMPATVAGPLEILLDGVSIFKSTTDGPITADFNGMIKGDGAKGTVTIKVGAMGFQQDRAFRLLEGDHIIFEAASSGLKVSQHANYFP